MNKRLNFNKLINNQHKYLTNITFVITFILIHPIFNQNILPLNVSVALISMFIYNIYPNIYSIVRKNNKKLIPYLLIYDIVGHWLPLIYILSMNLNETTQTNYQLCIIIVILYIYFFNKEISELYFNPDQYFE
jgi:hypothetical protein